ncbi:bifunctional acetate--CoA ligase family protein/GNAT family N-acetyltransferase, partial [Candidatus Bathyarchaeota archaeon]|nr:bifunctional acetate--CoA ligase family protein/GNAT family N-acetyltransferase [Candidatus Bathyarchaeota archaeon]
MGVEKLDRVFNPRRIAVVGASDRDNSVGAKLLKNLIGVGYKGAVYPVNPFRPIVQGVTAYPAVEKIPRRVDLAIVATPAHTVPQIIEECGKAGILRIIIISAGFREVGEEGEDLEKQIMALKEEYGMRIIGPNSLGVMRPEVKLNATFANIAPTQGKIAFISQSAALCSSVLDWASEAHVGFSAIVSVGSMLDVDFGDLIDYFGTDRQTKSIVLYIESIKDARKFMSAARGFARAKPIIVVKAGKFKESSEAAICHTGALCGEDAIYDAAFKRAGIVRVEEIIDLFNCAEKLAMQPNPKGPNLTIITNAGGPGIMATDTLIARGGSLSRLEEKTVKTLNEILPNYCSKLNPVDILEEATAERFRRVMEICLEDANSNGFLVIYTPQGASDPIQTAEVIVDLSRRYAQSGKPILTSLMGEGDCRRGRVLLRQNGIPAFSTPEEAVSTFMYMWSYTQNLELLYETPEELTIELAVPASLREILRKAVKEGRKVLSEPESLQFLEAYGIPAVKSEVATTPGEAVEVASRIGYPVVMKASSPQIIHKSRMRGVALNLRSEAEIEESFEELHQRVKNTMPSAEFKGVIIQPMVMNRGVELLIGSKRDAQFGSVVVFGTGGVATEFQKDVNVGFPPLNQILARRLIEGTKVHNLLSEGETETPDQRHLEEVLVKFSQLIIDFPEISEVDINPFIFSKTGGLAVDTRIAIDQDAVLNGTRPHEHLIITPYPKKYTLKWKIRNGKRVLLRPIKPEDENLLRELFNSLSEESMRYRFFQVIKEMSHETMTRYCNIDYSREIAIIAETQVKKKKIVGVARMILQPDRRKGEFAVVVADKWQGLGLGSKLVKQIIEVSKDMGLDTLSADVLTSNRKMLNLCKRKGFDLKISDEETQKATLKLV